MQSAKQLRVKSDRWKKKAEIAAPTDHVLCLVFEGLSDGCANTADILERLDRDAEERAISDAMARPPRGTCSYTFCTQSLGHSGDCDVDGMPSPCAHCLTLDGHADGCPDA